MVSQTLWHEPMKGWFRAETAVRSMGWSQLAVFHWSHEAAGRFKRNAQTDESQSSPSLPGSARGSALNRWSSSGPELSRFGGDGSRRGVGAGVGVSEPVTDGSYRGLAPKLAPYRAPAPA
jgi:hypothetical protein